MGICKKCKAAHSSGFYAARHGHYKCLHAIIEKEKKAKPSGLFLVVDDSDCYGESSLSRAAENGHYECLALLLKEGAEVDTIAANGNTPLISATHGGNVECVDALIKAGADVNGTTNAEYNGPYMEYKPWVPIVRAAQYGQPQCVELLIKSGADVNKTDQDDTTALMEAAKEGNDECIQVLLEADADVNKKDSWFFNTALMFAADTGLGKKVACLQLLLFAGAHVNTGPALKRCLLNKEAFEKRVATSNTEEMRQKFLKKVAVENEAAMLLLAAGEKTDADTKREILGDCVKKGELSLKHLCREFIREHLLKVDAHENLFVRVPKLRGLRSAVQDYLLYDMSLDAEENESETNESDFGPFMMSGSESDPEDDHEKYFTMKYEDYCSDEEMESGSGDDDEPELEFEFEVDDDEDTDREVDVDMSESEDDAEDLFAVAAALNNDDENDDDEEETEEDTCDDDDADDDDTCDDDDDDGDDDDDNNTKKNADGDADTNGDDKPGRRSTRSITKPDRYIEKM